MIPNTLIQLFRTYLFISIFLISASSQIISPASRHIQPISTHQTTGNTTGNNHHTSNSTFHLTGPGASVTFDFGRIVAGIPIINIQDWHCGDILCGHIGLPGFSCGHGCAGLGVAYTESEQFVGLKSDNSTFYSHEDGTLYIPVGKGMYTVPAEYSRGAFRYLTFSLSPGAAQSTSIAFSLSHIYFTASPQQDDLQEYSGHFTSSDPLLNRIWHAGVYTLQLCTISANSSVQHTRLFSSGWSNDAQAVGLEAKDVMLTDGAKRDRTPWPGDVNVELRSALVSLNFDNIGSVRNTLGEILRLQDAGSGYFPYAGSPLGDLLKGFGSLVDIPLYGSDTYHLWTIIGYVEYVLATRDVSFAQQHWKSVSRGLEATLQYVDNETSLMNGTKTLDWGRVGQGGQNTALNALLYHALNLMARLASILKTDQVNANTWTTMAEKLKTSANKILYDEHKGLFYDNTTSAGHTLYPQDGNVAAINFNLTTSQNQSLTIVENLSRRLTKYGAPSLELPGSISPFISSQELRAQFAASPRDASRAMNLLRTQWKYMMDAFSNATLIEGYADDGSLNYGFYPGGSGFISHAHGWSTGPVYSLVANVVGLRATTLDVSSEDGDWVFQPSVHGSDLMWARGGFNTSRGTFGVRWDVGEGNGFSARIIVPDKLHGTIYAPMMGDQRANVTVDGRPCVDSDIFDGFMRCSGVSGGSHHIKVA